MDGVKTESMIIVLTYAIIGHDRGEGKRVHAMQTEHASLSFSLRLYKEIWGHYRRVVVGGGG